MQAHNVVTCGRELDGINIPSNEFMKNYFLDQVKETVLVLARKYLTDYIRRKICTGADVKNGAGSWNYDRLADNTTKKAGFHLWQC